MDDPSTSTAPRCTIYYDGACPLCSAEIDLYRRIDRDGALALVDVAQAASPLPDGLGREAALARFHVRAADGRVVSGAAAFVVVWHALPGWRWLARLLDRPLLLAAMERAYRLFLRLRPTLSGLMRRWQTRRR